MFLASKCGIGGELFLLSMIDDFTCQERVSGKLGDWWCRGIIIAEIKYSGQNFHTVGKKCEVSSLILFSNMMLSHPTFGCHLSEQIIGCI